MFLLRNKNWLTLASLPLAYRILALSPCLDHRIVSQCVSYSLIMNVHAQVSILMTVLYHSHTREKSITPAQRPMMCGTGVRPQMCMVGLVIYTVQVGTTNSSVKPYAQIIFILVYAYNNELHFQAFIFFIHPYYSSTRGEFKVLLNTKYKYDSDTTNGMVMNCLSESVECSLLAIKLYADGCDVSSPHSCDRRYTESLTQLRNHKSAFRNRVRDPQDMFHILGT